MFGFLKPGRCDRQYRQVYAAYCSHQRQRYGALASIFTSYEAVFMYLLSIDDGLCAAPAKSTPTCCRFRNDWANHWGIDREVADVCSAVALVLARVKLEDDCRDAFGFVARPLAFFFHKPFREASRFLEKVRPGFNEELASYIEKHLQMEKEGFVATSIDGLKKYAAPTAAAFELVFETLAVTCAKRQPKHVDVELFRRVGSLVGSAILISDCMFDFHRDQQSGAFSPLPSRRYLSVAKSAALACVSEAGWLLSDRFESERFESERFEDERYKNDRPMGFASCRVLRNAFHVVNRFRFDKAAEERTESLGFQTKRMIRFASFNRSGVCDCGGDCCGELCCSGCDGCCEIGMCCDADQGNASCCSPTPCDICCIEPRRSAKKSSGLQAKKTSGDISDDSANSLVGRKASVTSSLRPFGVVKLDGEEMAAKLMSGHADVGEEVVIVGRGAFGFLVEPVRK